MKKRKKTLYWSHTEQSADSNPAESRAQQCLRREGGQAQCCVHGAGMPI